MNNKHYILDKWHQPIEVDLMAWANWVGDPKNKIVKQEDVKTLWVSTVFLGLDHNWGDKGPPILFETMVFGMKADGEMNMGGEYQDRCATWEEAEEMHKKGVEFAVKYQTWPEKLKRFIQNTKSWLRQLIQKRFRKNSMND